MTKFYAEIDLNQAGVVRHADAPGAEGLWGDNHTLERRLHHHIATLPNVETAEAVALLLNSLPDLRSGTANPTTWENCRIASNVMFDPLLSAGESPVDHSIQIVPRDHGSYALNVRVKRRTGRIVTLVWAAVGHGDASDAREHAELIASLPVVVPRLLAEMTAAVHFMTTIDGTSLVVDAADRTIVDSRKWKIKDGHLVDRQGNRLADAILALDGVRHVAHVDPDPDHLGDIDYRRCRLTARDQRQMHALDLPPSIFTKLQTLAKKQGITVGDVVTNLVQAGAP